MRKTRWNEPISNQKHSSSKQKRDEERFHKWLRTKKGPSDLIKRKIHWTQSALMSAERSQNDPQVVAIMRFQRASKKLSAHDLFPFRTSACREEMQQPGASRSHERVAYISRYQWKCTISDFWIWICSRRHCGKFHSRSWWKSCAAALAPTPTLSHIFQRALDTRELPADWKTGRRVTPIF